MHPAGPADPGERAATGQPHGLRISRRRSNRQAPGEKTQRTPHQPSHSHREQTQLTRAAPGCCCTQGEARETREGLA